MKTRRRGCSGSNQVFHGRCFCLSQLLVVGKVRGDRIDHCLLQGRSPYDFKKSKFDRWVEQNPGRCGFKKMGDPCEDGECR